MSRRYRLLFLLALLLTLVEPVAAGRSEPVADRPLWGDEGLICTGPLVQRGRHACIPDAHSADVRLPDDALTVTPVKPRQDSIVPLTYAQVVRDHAPVYGHPAEGAYGLSPQRRLGPGFIWFSVQGRVTYEERDYYQINAGEYVPAEDLSLYRPSAFQGLALAEHPQRPLAWILKAVQPRLTPQGEVNPDAPVYQRYQLVQIYATEGRGDQVWYLVNPDQWVDQVYLGKVTPSAPPPGVGAGSAWIDVSLFEQTLAAYVGDRMVYATLVSSGLPGWDTPPGLFQVWHKAETGKMSGAYNQPDYYFLEDVPWALYFNQAVALHGAYWHNSFGYRHSHGCVNLAPADARWLFNWAPDALWVWVHPGQEVAAN